MIERDDIEVVDKLLDGEIDDIVVVVDNREDVPKVELEGEALPLSGSEVKDGFGILPIEDDDALLKV